MAKIVKCPFCGKDIKKGLFSDEYNVLDLGETMIDCCTECYSKYGVDEKFHAKRFLAKLQNYKRATKTKKISPEQQLQMYVAYRQEGLKYGAPQNTTEKYSHIFGAIRYTADGRFSIKEFSNDFLESDVSAKDMARSAEKALSDPAVWFTKDDITKIEYFSNGAGSFDGLTKYYSYSIRFNDESQLTYRPAITRVFTVGTGMFGSRKKAEDILLATLVVFQNAIGTHFPVTRVEK